MSKKHFIELANTIKADGTFTKRQLEAIASFCSFQNGQFKRERWLRYIEGKCGPNGGEVKS